jgi:hypothetical protein
MSEKETVFEKKKNVPVLNEEETESSMHRFYYNLIDANDNLNRIDFDRQMKLEKIRKNSFRR